MDDRELSRMFDPLAEHNLWELNSGNVEFSLSQSFNTGTMDPLPENLYPLSRCIHPEGREPTPEQVSKFVQLIDDAYRLYLGGGLNEESG
jgi:hypothetical protein